MNTSAVPDKILLLMAEDEFSRLIQEIIRGQMHFKCDIIDRNKRSDLALDELKARYFVMILDIDTCDNSGEDILNDVLDLAIPLIIFTEKLTDNLREVILTKNIIDYLIKGEKNFAVVDQLISILQRVHKNRDTKILVVDDSSVSRAVVKDVLSVQNFHQNRYAS